MGFAPGSGPTAFVGVRLLDARSADAVEDGVLVVGGDGRIMDAGPARTVDIPGEALRIDGGGWTLAPGLVDCHVHLTGAHEAVHDAVRMSTTDYVVRALTTGRAWLEAGVTTIRDAGGASAGVKRAFADGTMPGPRTQVSVGFLSQTGGHGDGWTPSGTDLLGIAPPDLPPGICDGVEQCRKAARLQIRAGADWLKVMATGGVYSVTDSPDASQFTEDELRVFVEEAAAAGLAGVVAHAEGTRGILNALRGGVRSIEHGDLVDDEGIDLMLARDVPLVPTFLIVEEMIRPDRVADGVTPPWAVEKIGRMMDRQRERFREAVRRGVRVAMGTDGGRARSVRRLRGGHPGGRATARPRRRDRDARAGQGGRPRARLRRSARGAGPLARPCPDRPRRAGRTGRRRPARRMSGTARRGEDATPAATATRAVRSSWRAVPGDLLGRMILVLAGVRVSRRVEVEGIGRVDLAEDTRLGRWLDRVPGHPTAMTFGGVVVARMRLEDALIRHEAEHVRQWGLLGPLFLPAYLVASALARGRGDDRYRGNPLEAAAFAAEGGPRAIHAVSGYDTQRSSGSPRA